MTESFYIPQTFSKEEKYKSFLPQLKSLVETETDCIANLANITSALKYTFHFFWVGFYFVKGNELVLGPFQGTLVCTRIPFGKGVCGTCWQKQEIIVVPDVEKFPGHIACSSFSKSEIVLPIFNKEKQVIMVMDIDSDKENDFDTTDSFYLQQIASLIETFI